jgi:hypothetical protein
MALIPGTLPNDTCYGTPQDLLELFAQYLDVPAFALSSKVVFSTTNTGFTSDIVWFDTTSATRPIMKITVSSSGFIDYVKNYITAAPVVTIVGADSVLILDASDSSNTKRGLVSDIVSLVTPGVANRAFFFAKSTDQTVTTNTTTKCTFDTTVFNQSSIITLSSSTFTPTVSGYYQITAQIHALDGGSGAGAAIAIYKNGSATNGIHGPVSVNGAVTSSTTMVTVSGIMNFNGTSDTFEIYGRTYSVTWKVGSATAVLAIPSLTYATYVHGFYLGA